MRFIAVFTAALAVASLVLATSAEAQSSRKSRQAAAAKRNALTVTPRSYLNPGPVVPVGSLNNYVAVGQSLSPGSARPNFQGPQQQSPLRGPFDVPGRPFSPPAAFSN